MRLCREDPPNDIRNDLSARDEQTAHRDQSSSKRTRRKFTNVHGHHETRASDRGANDAPAEYHAPDRCRESLYQRANNEQYVRDQYNAAAPQRVCKNAGKRRRKEREEGRRRRNKRFIEGGERPMREGGVYGYQGRGYDAGATITLVRSVYRLEQCSDVLITKQQPTASSAHRQSPDKPSWRHQRALVYLHAFRIVIAVSRIVWVFAGVGDEWLRSSVGHAMELYVFGVRQREVCRSIEL